MAVIRETNLQVFLVRGDDQAPVPISGGVTSFEANLPLQVATMENVGRFCQVEMVTGMEVSEAAIEFTGISTEDLASILNFREPTRLQLFTNLVTETAESARANVVNRVIETALTFRGDLPLGNREQGELVTYSATGMIRFISIADNGVEMLYFNAFSDQYRINGESLIAV